MNKQRVNILTLIFFVWVNTLFAQQMPCINYTTHNGLPQIQVQKMHQDHKGYIWIGTKGGLAKFNGEKFEHFLRNKYIYSISETTQGELYFIAGDSIYKQKDGKLKSIDNIDNFNPSVYPFFITGNNKFWVKDLNNNLLEYRGDTLYRTFKFNKDFKGCLLTWAYDKKKNRLLLCTSTKCIYSITKEKIEKIFDSPYLETIYESYEGKIMYVMSFRKDEFTYINPDTQESYFSYKQPDDNIVWFDIKKLPAKQIIFYNYEGNELYKLDSLTHKAEKIKLSFDKTIFAFIIDKDENYWAGTDNGLYQINNKVFKSFPRSYMNDCWTLIKGKDNHFYGGFFKSGLFRYDFENFTKTEIPVKGVHRAKEIDFYYGASKDEQQNLYFPTHYGLVKYDYKKSKIFDTYVSLITKYDPFSKNIIFGQNCGIGFIDEKEKITTYTDSTQQKVFGHISAIEIKDEDNIWLGGKKGLTIFNKKQKQFINLSNHYKTYPQKYVICLAKDQKENVWIGSNEGLWLYQAKKDQFTQIGSEFFNKKILSIISPDSSLLLIGTSYEIYAMRLDLFYRTGKIEYKMFNYHNGFFSEETAQNGFYLDGDKVYIPSSTTTSVMNYKEIDFKPEFFDLFITKINGKPLSDAEQKGEKPFNVQPGVNKLDIDYETVGFGFPTYKKFKYKLEGEDKQWSAWTNKHSVSYSGLKSGKYMFKIIAQSGNYIEPMIEKAYHVDIDITLPFYKEPKFIQYAFYVFFLLTAILAILIWLTYKEKMEANYKERQIKLLEVAALQAQINPHFIFNFLSSMQGLISKNMPEQANNYLVKFSRLIRAYMESSIKSTKLLSDFSLDNENSIKEEMDMLKTYIELEILKYPKKDIQYKIDIEHPELLNKTIPPMILQPFVENAIKHGLLPAGKGTITIAISQEDELLICKIIDDGIGRKQSAQHKKHSISANKSRGLQLITNRIKLLNQLYYHIEILFEDPEEGGTIVIIKIQNQ